MSSPEKPCGAFEAQLEPTSPSELPTADDAAIFRMRCGRHRAYSVLLCDHALTSPASPLPALLEGRQALVVTTRTVSRLYGRPIEALSAMCERSQTLVLNVNEDTKTHATVESICRAALAAELDRRSALISIGGGVCTDLTSYAASLIRRGVECIRIPTTLIGQVDAGIGVKAAVNFDGKKSYLGCFSPPQLVVLDPTFLRTLPRCEIQRGLAEIIKIALICDAELFSFVETHWPELVWSDHRDDSASIRRLIEVSARRMLEQLQENPFEDKTYQRLVDAGHTFSPLIEARSQFAIHHGEAVAVDLCLSATIAAQAGLMSWDARERVVELVWQIGLPIFTPVLTEELCIRALGEAARHRGGQTNLVLPSTIGRGVFVDDVRDLPATALTAALDRLRYDDRAERRVPTDAPRASSVQAGSPDLLPRPSAVSSTQRSGSQRTADTNVR